MQFYHRILSVCFINSVTLENVIGKVMKKVVCKGTVWKLELEVGVAINQNTYQRQKLCVQTFNPPGGLGCCPF